MKLMQFQSTFKYNKNYLVAGKDSSVIRFEISGADGPDFTSGPKFYYTTTDGVSHEVSQVTKPAAPV